MPICAICLAPIWLPCAQHRVQNGVQNSYGFKSGFVCTLSYKRSLRARGLQGICKRRLSHRGGTRKESFERLRAGPHFAGLELCRNMDARGPLPARGFNLCLEVIISRVLSHHLASSRPCLTGQSRYQMGFHLQPCNHLQLAQKSRGC